MAPLLVKFYNHVEATVIFPDIPNDAFPGFEPVAGGEAAGHSHGRLNDVAVVDTFPLNDIYFIANLYKALAFHFEFYFSHDKIPFVFMLICLLYGV